MSLSGNIDHGPWKRFLNVGDVLDFENTLNFALFKDQSKQLSFKSNLLRVLFISVLWVCQNIWGNYLFAFTVDFLLK